ncbi:MAG TPA: hypothetical protein V6D28_03285 [Leptolyngbyaceae cyanobacterium]
MFNFKSFRYALLGTCLLLATSVGVSNASNANSSTNALKQSSNSRSSVHNFCSRRGLRSANYFETASFRVYICANRRGKYFYNGVSKRNGNAITLPAITEEGTGYVAKNGQYEYVVNGAFLSISRGNRVIQEERVIRSN